MHLVADDHNIVKQEANKDFPTTEGKNEHESVAISSNPQTSEEFSIMLDLPKQGIDVASVQQHLKKNHLVQLQVMNFAANTVTLEEVKNVPNWTEKMDS